MSRNEPKTAKGRQGTNNTQTSTKPVNKDLETYRKQIDSVKNIITNWNEEDILKVLERCGFEPDLAVSTIIDGYEGEQPTQWKEVTRKVKTEKSKDKKRDQGRPRGPRKTNENKDNNDKKTDRRSGPKEGQSVNGSTQHRGSKEHMENKEKDSQVKESNENSKEVPPQQPVSVPVVSQPKYVKENFSDNVLRDTWAQKLQMDLNNHQKSSHPTKREEEHRKAAEHNQQAKPQAAPKKEEVKKENPPSSVQQAQPTPTDNSFNQQYPSARQYNPPGMKWKPKESKSSDNESPLPQTSNPVHSNANSIVQAQSQTVRQAPSQTTTQKVISAPVVLPSVLAAEIDASDLQFGNFNNGAYERQETTQITNLTTSTTTANNHVETTITEQHVQVREQETAVPQQQMPIPQQQGAPGFTYMPLTGRPNFVGNYGAQMSHYSGFDGEMNHFTPYDQEAITARQQMMPFDPQSVIPPPSFTHTREPSPSDSNKYVSRSDSNQGFRDTNKFSQQQEQTPNTNTTAPGVTPNAQQQAYGYSPAMYAYPYINPYNNPNSQYYPRFYPRTYIPNNPQGYPAPTTSSNLYAEEMVQPEYGKNMFSAMPSFFQPTDQSMNLVGKNQPSHLHQTTTPGKSQSFSPPPTVPQQGATSPEIQPNSYKAPQMSFNTGRETTSAPSAYYNNMAQQQYQQTSNFPYMMPQQQPFPRGGQQQQYMQN